MRPYYDEDGITIYHGDCRDVLPIACDLVVTDPPYGVEYSTGYRKGIPRWTTKITGDDIDHSSVISMLAPHLSDNGAVYWFCSEIGIAPFYEAAMLAGLSRKRMVVWDKGNWAAGDLTGDWAVQTEYVAWAAKGDHRLRGPRPVNLVTVPRQVTGTRYADHPSEKPEALICRIVSVSSDEGDTILDPFMGTGTTLVASKRLRRKAVGIEIEERYCEIAAKRVRQRALDFSAVLS